MAEACCIFGPTEKSSGVRKYLENQGISARLFPSIMVEGFIETCKGNRPRVVVVYCQDFPDYGAGLVKAVRENFDGEIATFALFDPEGPDAGVGMMKKAGVREILSVPLMSPSKIADAIKTRWYNDAKGVAEKKPCSEVPPRLVPIPGSKGQVNGPTQKALKEMRYSPPLTPEPVSRSVVGNHGQVLYLDPRRVRPLPDQPRKQSSPGFSPESIAKLGRSMKNNGQMEEASVCPICDDSDYDAQLIDGERRQRGSLAAGVMLRVTVREDVAPDDVKSLYLMSIIRNDGKEPHTIVEFIDMVQRLRGPEYDFTQTEVGATLNRTQTWVSQMETLGTLSPSIIALIDVGSEEHAGKKRVKGKLTLQLALLLIDIEQEKQLEVAQSIVGQKMSYNKARRYVLNARRDLGLARTASGRTRPSKQFKALATLTRRNIDAYGVYTDMMSVAAEREPLIRSGSLEERQTVSQNLLALAASLNELANWIG